LNFEILKKTEPSEISLTPAENFLFIREVKIVLIHCAEYNQEQKFEIMIPV
jgi:hypothetical protein